LEIPAPAPHLVIAIDGPAASGTSSVARALARRLGFVYVNTGAMYRAVTWYVTEKGVSCANAEAVLSALAGVEIRCGVQDGESTITIGGLDPAPHLLSPVVNANVSQIAAIPEVRRQLVALQREYALGHDVVMEGRDIGSAVFPETLYKFYIDASPEVRAQRRQRQGLLDSVQSRDRQDSSRRTSPLIIAEEAHVIDSSKLTVDGVVGELIGRLKMHGLEIEDGPSFVKR
jgi:CMP/dCMP kinase